MHTFTFLFLVWSQGLSLESLPGTVGLFWCKPHLGLQSGISGLGFPKTGCIGVITKGDILTDKSTGELSGAPECSLILNDMVVTQAVQIRLASWIFYLDKKIL